MPILVEKSRAASAAASDASSPADVNKTTTTTTTTTTTLPQHDAVHDVFAGNDAAKASSNHEQQMSTRYTIRYYHTALFWAAVMAAPIVLQGYETALVPTFFASKSFQQIYGSQIPSSQEYTVPSAWQSGIAIAAFSGQLVGLVLAPRMLNRLGYRVCSALGCIWAACSLTIGFWSQSTSHPLAAFMVGEMLLGIPWGLFQGTTLPYVSDITPLALRGPATAMINVFWLVGQLVAAAVMRGACEIKDAGWSIRAPMLVQYAWLAPLLFAAFMAPESPLFLSRNDQDQQAKETLRRLSRDPLFDGEACLAMISAVDRHEMRTSAGMGLRQCFRGVNLRRTEIAVLVYVTQQLVGTPLVFYSVKILREGGLSQNQALCITVGIYTLCIVSTLCSMAAMRRIGRRKLWLGGLAAEMACLGAIGGLSFFLERSDVISWTLAAFVVLFAAIYNFTIGPVCYTVVAETPATRLKAATNSVARGAYIVFSMVNLFLVPNLLEDAPDGWGLGSKAALVWAGTAGVCLVWAFFRLPEMKDRTPAQVDVLFEQKVTARSWAGSVVWSG